MAKRLSRRNRQEIQSQRGFQPFLRDGHFFGIRLVIPNFGITSRSAPPEENSGLKMPEELSSLRFPDWLRKDDLRICSLKMFPTFYRMTKDGHLRSSSPRFMSWGIMSNGLCLTAKISESRSQGGGSSLSDILIPDAPEKYFLSSAQEAKLLYRLSEADRDTGSTTQAA